MPVPPIYDGLDRLTNEYAAAFLATWREARAQATDPSYIPFTKVLV
jgi:hypothetical protein